MPPPPSAPAEAAASPATRDAADSDLDPAAFLRSVRELSERREREDSERIRKLEEEVEKGRQERAARRAERARSISPEKFANSSPASGSFAPANLNARLASPPPLTPPSTRASVEPELRRTPAKETEMDSSNAQGRTEGGARDVPEFKGFKRMSTTPSARSSAEVKSTPESSGTSTPSATSLARSGTLSWQRRPASKPGTASRPASMLVNEPSANLAPSTPTPAEPSREQIAASLGSRDPSWFKQTADRGIGSAAYRKSNDEVTPSVRSSVSERRGLPDMSRESSIEPESQPSARASESLRADNISRGGSVRNSTATSSLRSSHVSAVSSKPDLKSLIAADEDQRKASPGSVHSKSTDPRDSGPLERTPSMSSSQARLSNTDRPTSPTKGVGGFVQSAMMKRSDSQIKRWSQQPGGTLSRQNSLASRAGLGGLQGSYSMPKLDAALGSKEDSLSRPSSASNTDLTSLASAPKSDNDGFVKPALPRHSRSKSVASTYSNHEDGGIPASPGSPSKRWSPTKSSWIESALIKPDSPKPLASKNSQPDWMANLAKAKAQRSSGETFPAEDPIKASETKTSRPASPLKAAAPFGQGMLRRSESQDLATKSAVGTPGVGLKPLKSTEKFAISPAASPAISRHATPKPEERPSTEPEPSSADSDKDEKRFSADVTEPLAQAQSIPAPLEAAVEKVSTPEPKQKPKILSPKPSPSLATSKPKPEAPPKPATDFRSNLKSRPNTEAKPATEPEFLSKFGHLRKTQQEKYVAPDVLKDNILRGKSGLTVTGGPVKTVRRDELKESLLAKKDDIRKAKEEGRDLPGQAHERKTSAAAAPQTPMKPEALAKRELLGRSDSARTVPATEEPKQSTPEALVRHKSLRQKPAVAPPLAKRETSATTAATADATFKSLEKQISAPAVVDSKAAQETSKLAARFNPGLAGFLARGPPSAPPSRTGTPSNVNSDRPASSAKDPEPPTDTAQLSDMRKDRAKGPKRRKGGAKADVGSSEEPSPTPSVAQSNLPTSAAASKPALAPRPHLLSSKSSETQTSGVFKAPLRARTEPFDAPPETPEPVRKAKPQALPGSAASLMIASLNKKAQVDGTEFQPSTPAAPSQLSGPRALNSQPPPTPNKSPLLAPKASALTSSQPSTPAPESQTPVPEFKGFGSAKPPRFPVKSDDDKENADNSASLVGSPGPSWMRKPSTLKSERPAQIELPTRKDEEAVLRSAGLLSGGLSKDGLGINIEKPRDAALTPPASAGLPPKPAKSSRAVSGQLAEASPNRSPTKLRPSTEARRCLQSAFGAVPKYQGSLAVDTQAVLDSSKQKATAETTSLATRTLRKAVYVVEPNGATKPLPPKEDYTFFDESVYVCSHVYANSKGSKAAQVFVWAGESAAETTVESAHSTAKQVARDHGGSVPVQLLRQGLESAAFLQAMGGIFVTRQDSRDSATKQYMLCGRKHLGQIVFDEVEFAVWELCHAFVYLVSYPVTLQETRLFLWKGMACSPEEISAARLAAMDLSENIVEVDGGAEFSSFLKIFGAGVTKSDVPGFSPLWQRKTSARSKFAARLYRIQQQEIRPGLFSGLWSRRPSWNSLSSSAPSSRSPSRPRSEEIKVEVKEISPFTQSQLDAEGIYLLDAYAELWILPGPLFASPPSQQVDKSNLRNTLLAQTLLLASDYAILSASLEDRPAVPKGYVLLLGGTLPREVKVLFRHLDESRGLWGTAGLMAGLPGTNASALVLDEVLEEICGSG